MTPVPTPQGDAQPTEQDRARARECVGQAWVLWGQRRGWTPENEVFNPSEWEPFVEVIAAALAGVERERGDTLRAILAPLRDLAAKAGPLPVKATGALIRFDGQCGKVYHDGCLVADFGVASAAHHITQCEARAEYIAAGVNALPALLTLVERDTPPTEDEG